MSAGKQRLSNRLFVTFFALSMLIFAASAAAVVTVSWVTYEGNAEGSLSSQVEVTADRLVGKSEEQMVEDLQSPLLADIRVTLIAGDGSVLYDSYANDATMENHAARAEVVAARKGGSSVTFRRSFTTGADTLYAAVVVDGSDCVLRLAETRASLPYYLGSMVAPLAIIVVLAVAISLLFARSMARRIARPLLDVDLEDPLSSDAYVEVQPLLARIDGQRTELLAKNEQLERSAQMRREFTGNVSHEMKSPLQVIGGYAELIESGMAKGDDAIRFAGVIRSESQSMRELVDDVLTLSRLDEGINDDDSFFDLSEVCRRVARRRDVNVAFRLPECALVKGPEALAEQMVYNLVDNAVRYGCESGEIEVSLERDDDNWLLLVSDDGPGIPEDLWDRVFERFYRVDSSRSRETGGTGLGLAIVKHAAESLGGSVSIVAPRLGGTTVQVTVPFLVEEAR